MAREQAVTSVCRLASWLASRIDGRFCLALATVMRSIALAMLLGLQHASIPGELDLEPPAVRKVCYIAFAVGKVSLAKFGEVVRVGLGQRQETIGPVMQL